MIYLDVTSSCKSPLNTGVQRVVRALHRVLAARAPVTPLVWNPGFGSYCTLSPRERRFLEDPFGGSRAGDAEPGRRANPIPLWSKFARRLVHRWNRLDAARLTAADTLFIPEIFQDNRVRFLDALARRRAPARRVAVCHDLINIRRPDLTPPARQAGYEDYLNALGTLDHVVAVSRQTVDDLADFWRERGHPAAPVSVCHWPVVHAGEPRPLTPPPPAGPTRRSVLCVGTFEPRKNHLVLLAAAGLLWRRGVDFELVLVGRTTPDWGARVLAAIEAARAAGHPVRWLRHVDDDTLRRAYADCAFTVFPTLIEGFGLPILESLWHGRPCVCGTNGALGEVSAGGGCLAVEQTDPAALATALETLLANPAMYQHFCTEARDRTFDTWEGLASRLMPILQVG